MSIPLPESIRGLLPSERPGLVVPARPPAATASRRLELVDLFPEGFVDEEAALDCLAGVLLLRDDFARGHAVCQDLDGVDAAYWHGIAHRREPDAGNAKYWMRRVGPHPIHEPLAHAVLAAGAARAVGTAGAGGTGTLLAADPALATVSGRWDAGRFIDACSSARMTPEVRAALESWQWHESLLLLAHGAGKAVGRGA